MQVKTLLLLTFFSLSTFALDDTPENREREAKRYMDTMPPKAMLQDMANNMSMNFPPEDRQGFRDLIMKHVDIDVISNTTESSMVNVFTADELAALADFYELDIAKSAMGKFGLYMAEVMPIIQAEMMRAVGELEREKAEKNRALPDLVE